MYWLKQDTAIKHNFSICKRIQLSFEIAEKAKYVASFISDVVDIYQIQNAWNPVFSSTHP